MLHRGNSEYRRPFGVAILPPRNGHGRRHSAGIPLSAQARRRGGARFPDRAPLLCYQLTAHQEGHDLCLPERAATDFTEDSYLLIPMKPEETPRSVRRCVISAARP